jgi:hypothetical protein
MADLPALALSQCKTQLRRYRSTEQRSACALPGPTRSEGVAAFMNDASAFVVKAPRLMR